MGNVRQATLVPLPVCLWPDLTTATTCCHADHTETDGQTDRQTDRQTDNFTQLLVISMSNLLAPSKFAVMAIVSFISFVFLLFPPNCSLSYQFLLQFHFFFLPFRFKPVLTLLTRSKSSSRYSFQRTKVRMWLLLGRVQ